MWSKPEYGHLRARGNVVSLCALCALLVGVPANAGLITYEIDFNAHTFVAGVGPSPAPVDPVTGKVLITLDPTVTVTNSTANISLISLNITLGSAISFSYDPTNSNGFLTIGGINAGSGIVNYDPPTNDFWLFIKNFTTTPSFWQLGYSQTSVGGKNLYYTLQDPQYGSVSVNAVPEPSSLVLGSIGAVVAGLGGWRRRKRAG